MRQVSKLIVSALLVSFSLAAVLKAKPRQWLDATVVDAKSGPAGSISTGTVSGTQYGATGLAVSSVIVVTYYTIDTGDMLYVVGCVPRGTLRYKCPDITVHGKTKIAIEGRDAHVLDDEGKDRKVPIIEKILKQESPKP